MNAIIYCRISIPRPEENSLNAQENIARDFIKRNGLQIQYICRESGSAYNKTPPKLKNILTNERNVIVIIKCVDRFCRNVEEGKKLLTLAAKNRIKLTFVQEQIIFQSRKSGDKILAHVRMAEQEVKRMADRIKDINRDKKANGLHIGGTVPFGSGIQRTHLGNKLVVNECENAIINLIYFLREDRDKKLSRCNKLLKCIDATAVPISFDDEDGEPVLVMKGYMSYREIADLLNDYRITKRGAKWNANSVAAVYKKRLRNMGIVPETQAAIKKKRQAEKQAIKEAKKKQRADIKKRQAVKKKMKAKLKRNRQAAKAKRKAKKKARRSPYKTKKSDRSSDESSSTGSSTESSTDYSSDIDDIIAMFNTAM